MSTTTTETTYCKGCAGAPCICPTGDMSEYLEDTPTPSITATLWENLPRRNGERVYSVCGDYTLVYVQTATLNAYIMRTANGGHLVETAAWDTCITVLGGLGGEFGTIRNDYA